MHRSASLLALPLLLAVSAHAAPLQSADAVTQVVAAYLREQATHFDATPQITVDAASAARQPACDALQPFLAPGTRLRPRMSIGVRCAAPSAWTAYVQASIAVPGRYVVTARTLDVGDVITQDALATREADLLTLPPNALLRADDVLGSVATRRLPAGRPLRTDALRSADAVQRGQRVRLLVNGAGFVATSEGQVLAAAGPGSLVQVRTDSGQTVSGIVRDATTVVVPL
ncbi:flagellar basal body P-ring formation protein FlgA [Achromobacter sp. GG226]|uniref:flagellar basal body P-ring formation chaperone FlgA n=1 Tax=Verticiella alkaliphila TaxID=2779529 RepID=UPI001C0BB1F9|nr:flagellar basal body P-ring formation chaperone FlgA [Verticiella sp. GG226]MBU4610507.1 flagellar basal body P-ring formation protein FlgA [Verticiella sp. GG226]